MGDLVSRTPRVGDEIVVSKFATIGTSEDEEYGPLVGMVATVTSLDTDQFAVDFGEEVGKRFFRIFPGDEWSFVRVV